MKNEDIIMPSKLHQMIVGLIGRKMKEKGYEIVAFDGNEYYFDGQKLSIPPTIKRHKPDILGFKFQTKDICIGEAKTKNDLHSNRTKEQLIDYSNTKTVSTQNQIEIIIGVPKSAENDLIDLLILLKLNGQNNISFIWLPEELVSDG